MAELRTHLATERVRVVTLRLQQTRPSSIPTIMALRRALEDWFRQLTMDQSPDSVRRDELDQPDEPQNRTCRNDPDFQHLFPVERESL